jgi:hypothetical protein
VALVSEDSNDCTFRPSQAADVVAGSPDSYLVIAYTAGRQLSDGTIKVVLPGGQWRTRLSAVNARLTVDAEQAVAVRPWSDLPEPEVDPAAACSPLAATPAPLTVETVLGSQVIVVQHVNCAAEQKLFVHVKDIAAPSRTGRYFLPVVASEQRGLPRLSVATVTVVPIPRVALRVTVPATVEANVPFPVTVEAVRPDGSRATDYRGAVGVENAGPFDCSVEPSGLVHQFTETDAGTATFEVQTKRSTTHQLRVYDIANKAVAGVSNPFEVLNPRPALCSASYH